MNTQYHGVHRILRAFVNSWNGLKSAFCTQAAFRQDLLLCAVATVALIFIPVGMGDKILMFFSLWLIIIAELINTAIETVIDRIGPEYHEMSKCAKDIGSAIVLITITGVVLFWAAIVFMNTLF